MNNKNGGNGGGEKIDIKATKKTLEERQQELIENRRGQYFLMRLIHLLGIKPLKEKDGPTVRWIMINLEGLSYSLTEICEKAIDVIEIFRQEKTKE